MTDSHLYFLISIMFAAGVFGGVVATALDDEDFTKEAFLRNSLVGIAASFLVPLFLNTISSSIVIDSEKDPSLLLIFIGFCVIASIYSKKFIKTISEKVLKEEISKVEKSIEELKKEQVVGKFYKDSLFHIQNKNYELALNTLNEWCLLDKKSSQPYLGKGSVYKAMGKYQKAVEMTTQAIEMNDQYQFKGYYNRACYKNKASNFELPSIIEDLKIAIKMNPAYKEYAMLDGDLTSLHDEADFKKLFE